MYLKAPGLPASLWGERDYRTLYEDDPSSWQILSINNEVVFSGDRSVALDYLNKNGGQDKRYPYKESQAKDYAQAISGFFGKSTSGNSSISFSREKGVSLSGDNGWSLSGHTGSSCSGSYSLSYSGNNGRSTVGHFGIAVTGSYGEASTGLAGKAVAGENGIAQASDGGAAWAGIGGSAAAGKRGRILIDFLVGENTMTLVAHVGVDGIKPNVFYRLSKLGVFEEDVETNMYKTK
jgi:hypothetical protein